MLLEFNNNFHLSCVNVNEELKIICGARMKKSLLFPSPIWMDDFTNDDQFKIVAELSEAALEEVKHKGDADRRSNRGNSLHTSPNFLGNYIDTPLYKLLTPSIVAALGDYGYDVSFEVSITYWSIVSYAGAYNERHHHANSLLSGAFYTSAPEGSGALVFSDPRYGKFMETRIGRVNVANFHQNHRIEPRAGRLVLFPSYLEHHVEVSSCEQPRIIYSFNVDIHGPKKIDK